MDVTLVLTHRCNLGCDYCYAGEHVRRDMDDATLDRAVELLGSDGAPVAQLGFFGGEPFLAFDAMKRAIERAQRAAAERRFRLLLQCTTNGTLIGDDEVELVRASGMKVTVSIDGVKEAQDLNRPLGGGGSSFAQTLRGLRKLVAAGVDPDAMMVISPQTVGYVYQSVSWLWAEGVRVVRANMVLDAPWYASDRDELRAQLHSVACELVGRRMRGETVAFEPFRIGERQGLPERSPPLRGAKRNPGGGLGPQGPRTMRKRQQVAVATAGNLYPCSPMVGEDRDHGREAQLRLGHLSDGAEAIAARVRRDGAGCGDGKNCACAAYLETGDRSIAGPNGLWYAAVCREMGELVARGLAAPAPAIARRPLLIGAGALLAGVAAAVPAMMRAGWFSSDVERVDMPPPGQMVLIEPVPPPQPPPAPPDEPQIGGAIAAPEPPPPETMVDGDIAAPPPPPEPAIKGQLAAPPEPPPEEIRTRGDIAAPR